MKHGLRYRIARWLIQHSSAAMTYVVEMRNEVSDYYENREERIAEADCIRRIEALRCVDDRVNELLKDPEFRKKGYPAIIDIEGVKKHLAKVPTVNI